MNYSVVIIGGISILAATYWFISARHWFVGPKRTDIHTKPLPPGHVTTEDETIFDSAPSIVESRFWDFYFYIKNKVE